MELLKAVKWEMDNILEVIKFFGSEFGLHWITENNILKLKTKDGEKFVEEGKWIFEKDGYYDILDHKDIHFYSILIEKGLRTITNFLSKKEKIDEFEVRKTDEFGINYYFKKSKEVKNWLEASNDYFEKLQKSEYTLVIIDSSIGIKANLTFGFPLSWKEISDFKIVPHGEYQFSHIDILQQSAENYLLRLEYLYNLISVVRGSLESEEEKNKEAKSRYEKAVKERIKYFREKEK